MGNETPSASADRLVTAVVYATGEIDLATADDFYELLTAALEARPNCLVVDMSDVTFMDACGLGKLVSARNKLLPNGRLELRHVPAIIRMELAVTNLDAAFVIES